MLIYFMIKLSLREKLFKSENKSKSNFKPLKTEKSNKSETSSNSKKVDLNPI